MPDKAWWAALWPDPARVIRALGVTPNMTVVDLCCGDGYFTAPLASCVGGKVYALDLSAELIGEAEAYVTAQGATVSEWICGDARDLAKLVPHDMDFVLIANTFHGVPDQTALARAVGQVLKTGGHFVIVNWHPRPREDTQVLGEPRGPQTEMRMAPEAVQAVVESAGFKLANLIDLPPYHYGAVFQKL